MRLCDIRRSGQRGRSRLATAQPLRASCIDNDQCVVREHNEIDAKLAIEGVARVRCSVGAVVKYVIAVGGWLEVHRVDQEDQAERFVIRQ